MRKILLIPLIATLGLFMVLGMYYNGYIPTTVQSMGLSPIMDESELYTKSVISVHGTLIAESTDITFVKNGGMEVPYVYTTWTLLTIDSLKGETGKTVEFKTIGGIYKNIEHIDIYAPHMEIGDDVLVFLSLDEDSEWGNSYYLTGIQSGIYTIDSKGMAHNEFKDVNVDLSELKTNIRSFES